MKHWIYQPSTMSVRQMPENYCLFSSKTFVDGGTYDSAVIAQAEENLILAASAPELLAALEAMYDEFYTEGYRPDGALAKAVAVMDKIKTS